MIEQNDFDYSQLTYQKWLEIMRERLNRPTGKCSIIDNVHPVILKYLNRVITNGQV